MVKYFARLKAVCVLLAVAGLFASSFCEATCLQWPIASSDWSGRCRVASGWGWRADPYKSGIYEFHHAYDLACPIGTPVHAPVAGVINHDSSGDGGNHIVREISADLNAQTRLNLMVTFLHNSKWALDNAVNANQGDVIAYVGNEGHSQGPHTHMEITQVNQPVLTGNFYNSRLLASCAYPKILPDGTTKCTHVMSVDPATLFCAGSPIPAAMQSTNPPLAPSAGAFDPTTVISNQSNSTAMDASLGGFSSATPPNETPPAMPSGLDNDSRAGHLLADVSARAFNTEYLAEMATLGDVSLIRELTYIEGLETEMKFMLFRTKERQEALRAAILSVQLKSIKTNLAKQKNAAVAHGNASGS